jgi:hypothetical protein
MKIEGSCHCGRISYEAEVDPDNVLICHCTDCQTNSGAPYRANVPVLPEKFVLRGLPKTYVKTGGSGNKVVLAFCGDCGSAMYSNKLESPQYFNLRLGAVKQRAALVPKAQYFCNAAMPWVWDIGGIPKDPRRPPAAPSKAS